MPKHLIIAKAAACCLIVAANAADATAQTVARKDTLIFEHAQSPQPAAGNWNYLVATSVLRAVGLHQFVMEPLFVLNLETGATEPWLGLDMKPSADLKEWVLSIRPGVTWQDGEAFDADDVVFTIETMLKHAPLLRDSASLSRYVKSVEKVDPLTVKFTLKEPNPRFQLDFFAVRTWGAVMIVPEHIYRDKDPITFTNFDLAKGLPLGTGPYKLVRATLTEFTYDRVDNWWGAKSGFQKLPAPKRLVYILNRSEENRGNLAAKNDVDVVWDMSLGTFETIRARNPKWVTWQMKPLTAWLDPCHRGFDLSFKAAPWDDVEMRRALDLGIDRAKANTFAFDGISVPSRTVYPEYQALSKVINTLEKEGLAFPKSANAPEAKRIIESKGYKLGGDGIYEKDGKKLSVVFEVLDGWIFDIRMVEVLIEQLRQTGVNGRLQRTNFGTLEQHRATGDFEALVYNPGCGSVNEPWFALSQYSKEGFRPVGTAAPANYVRWSGPDNERFSEIVAELGALPLDSERVLPLTTEAYRIWFNAKAGFPVVHARFLLGFNQTYWKNWPTAENNYFQPAYRWHGWVRALAKIEPAN